MLLFCPACGNVLVAEEGPRCHRFACTTCPYVRNVTRKVQGGRGGDGDGGVWREAAASPRPLTGAVPAGDQQEVPAAEGGGRRAGRRGGLGERGLHRRYGRGGRGGGGGGGTGRVERGGSGLPSGPLTAPRPAEPCPKCEHPRAYFMQIQTRSADEPMTTFYKCCNPQCGHRWRD